MWSFTNYTQDVTFGVFKNEAGDPEFTMECQKQLKGKQWDPQKRYKCLPSFHGTYTNVETEQSQVCMRDINQKRGLCGSTLCCSLWRSLLLSGRSASTRRLTTYSRFHRRREASSKFWNGWNCWLVVLCLPHEMERFDPVALSAISSVNWVTEQDTPSHPDFMTFALQTFITSVG